MVGVGSVWISPQGHAYFVVKVTKGLVTFDNGFKIQPALLLATWPQVHFEGTWRGRKDGKVYTVQHVVNTESRNKDMPLSVVHTSEGCGFSCSAKYFYLNREKING